MPYMMQHAKDLLAKAATLTNKVGTVVGHTSHLDIQPTGEHISNFILNTAVLRKAYVSHFGCADG